MFFFFDTMYLFLLVDYILRELNLIFQSNYHCLTVLIQHLNEYNLSKNLTFFQ